ncbi:MAG: sugar ABC transporter permease [Oscillospiraceae bacterium]|nr:sugar ABC transporter permease [Oscillospiraceae bacterium]
MINAKKQLLQTQKTVVLTGNKKKTLKNMWEFRELYLFLALGVIWTFVFSYVTMYGLLMAFQDAKLGTIIGQADWIGLYHFDVFLNGIFFKATMLNSVIYSLLGNFVYTPCALALALLLHNSTSGKLKKLAQNLTYIPHMLSLVVVFSVLDLFVNHNTGLINVIATRITGVESNFNFYTNGQPILIALYLIVGVWQESGYSAIVYIGALSSVDEEMVEAARIDGATKWRIIWSIQLPTILPTVVTMMVMKLGNIFSVGTEKILLMQNDLNIMDTEVIGTYVYKLTTGDARYGFSTAVSVFQNVISLAMMLIVNKLGDKLAGISVI